MPVTFSEIPAGAVTGPGPARDELGQPYIIKPEDWIAIQKAEGFEGGDRALHMAAVANATSSLVDRQFNQQLEYRKALAGIGETNARTSLYGAQADNIQAESDVRKQMMPLDVQAKQIGIQTSQLQNRHAQIGLDEAQRNVDLSNKAYDELPDYRSAMNGLDFQDPELDSKIADIKRKYPNASTLPGTESLISPIEAQLYQRRQGSTKIQYNSAMMGGLEQAQQAHLIDPNIDVRKEVINGNGTQLLTQANRTMANKRLDQVIASGSPADQAWARTAQGQINGAQERGPEAPPMFGFDGALNDATEAQLSATERRLGITPQYPGAKMEVTRTINKETGKPETEYKITGMPPTTADIQAARGGVAGGAPSQSDEQAMAALAKDKNYQQALTDINQAPGNYPTQAAKIQAVKDRYNQLQTQQGLPAWGQQAQPPGQGVGLTPPPPAPAAPAAPARQPARARRGVPLSEAGEPGAPIAEATPSASPEYRGPDAYDAGQLDSRLGGGLRGHGDDFIRAGAKYGVDPNLLAAMSVVETANGTSSVFRRLNNTGGITGAGHGGIGGDYRPFESVADSIDEQARMIAHYRHDLGLRTIAQIGYRWAPPGGAANDPQRSNWQWPAMVAHAYNSLSG